MSSLYTALNLRVPNLWVHANEPFAWMDSFVEVVAQQVFFMDPGAGLVGFDRETRQWTTVVHAVTAVNPETRKKETKVLPIGQIEDAIDYVAEQNGTIMFFAGDQLIKDLMGFAASIHFRWRNSFYNDLEPNRIPQFVFLSPTAEIPPHLSSMALYINGNNAYTQQHVIELLSKLDESVQEGSVFENPEQAPRVTEYASGLTEMTTLDTVFGSIFASPQRKLRTQDVVDRKSELLRASTTLDYRQPQYTINDVAGLANAKQMIINAKWIVDNEEEATKWGLTPKRRFLLLGLPGTGKSMICEAAADALGLGLVQVGVSRAMNKFIGQSEENMRNMFDQLERLAPIVAWADEIGRDLSGGGSSNYTDGGTTARVHGEFLTRMQDLDPRVFFFAAANGLDHLSPEMLRAGRWDQMMYVGFPAFEERKEIFRLHLPTTDAAFNLDQLAELSPCWTGAEIVSVIQDTKNRIVPVHHRAIQQEDIITVMNMTRNRIWIKAKANVVESYRHALEEYEWASAAQLGDAIAIASGHEPNIKKVSKTIIG